MSHGDGTAKSVVVVFGAVLFLAGDVKTGGNVQIVNTGGPAIEKPGGIVDGFNRGSRLAQGGDDVNLAVDSVVIIVL